MTTSYTHQPFFKRYGKALFAALLLISSGFGAVVHARQVEPIHGRVVEVVDGDTLVVEKIDQTKLRIRLSNIDAPEMDQPSGARAQRVLSRIAMGQLVEVRLDAPADEYRRGVGKVLLGGRDLNLRMVFEGWAWHYKHYAESQAKLDREMYAESEDFARKGKLGLWAEGKPVAPWEYRKAGPESVAAGATQPAALATSAKQ